MGLVIKGFPYDLNEKSSFPGSLSPISFNFSLTAGHFGRNVRVDNSKENKLDTKNGAAMPYAAE
jgi:hypothetical protein